MPKKAAQYRWKNGHKYCRKYRSGANKYGPWKKCAVFGRYKKPAVKRVKKRKVTKKKAKKSAKKSTKKSIKKKTKLRSVKHSYGPLRQGYGKSTDGVMGDMPSLISMPKAGPLADGYLFDDMPALSYTKPLPPTPLPGYGGAPGMYVSP